MAFKLLEKFTLNETFLLNEADNAEPKQTNLERLAGNMLDEAIAKLKTTDPGTTEKVSKALDKIQAELPNNDNAEAIIKKDFSKYAGKIRTFLQKFSSLFTKELANTAQTKDADENPITLGAALNNLQELLSNPAGHEQELAQTFNIFANALKAAFNPANNVDKAKLGLSQDQITEISVKMRQLKAMATEAQDALKNGSADMSTELGVLNKQLENLIRTLLDSHQIWLTKGGIQEFVTDVNKATSTIKEFMTKLQNKEQPKEGDVSADKSPWDEKYENAKRDGGDALRTFWNQYIAHIATKNEKVDEKATKCLADLIRVLEKELVEYGFDDSNPFLIYLKTLFGKNIYPGYIHYAVVHNKFVDQEINTKDLTAEGYLKEANIIFSSGLFSESLDVRDESTLLHLQYQLSKKTFSDLTGTNTAQFQSMKDNPDNIAKTILYKNAGQTEVLNSASKAQALFNQAYGSMEQSKSLEGDELKAIATKIVNAVGKDQKKVLGIAAYIMMRYISLAADEKTRQSLFSSFPGLKATTISPEDLQNADIYNRLSDYKIPAGTAKKLILELCRAAGIENKTEKDDKAEAKAEEGA